VQGLIHTNDQGFQGIFICCCKSQDFWRSAEEVDKHLEKTRRNPIDVGLQDTANREPGSTFKLAFTGGLSHLCMMKWAQSVKSFSRKKRQQDTGQLTQAGRDGLRSGPQTS
jgi:hypothetical protein